MNYKPYNHACTCTHVMTVIMRNILDTGTYVCMYVCIW